MFPRRPLFFVLALSLLLVTIGCDDAPNDEPTPDDEPDTPQGSASDEPEADPRLEIAQAADRKLRQTLMGRVQEVMGEDGPAAAVDICHKEAIPITEDIADEFGVAIGRISDQPRNPDNTGEDWVWSMIDTAGGEARMEANDTFRRITPIELADGCTTCHGQQDDIPQEVAEIVSTHYPNDQATGYEPGDLRGWVWVEVP